MKLSYLYSKGVQAIQTSSLRNCKISKKAKVGKKSNFIDVTIGDFSYTGNNNSFCCVSIGKFCSIASYCAIGGGDHPCNYVSTSPVFYSKNNIFHKSFCEESKEPKSKRVTIGNDVWIGENCFIKSGLTIGDGSIIGAHSVVTKNVEPYSIVVGNPSKILRFRFDKETIEWLLSLRWWDWDDSKLKRYGTFFDDPLKLRDELLKNGEQ